MQLHELKIKKSQSGKKSQRVGRGGKRGKTSGKGHKGQNARAGRKKRPEMRDIIKKLPKLRGHGQNRARTVNSSKQRIVPINLSALNNVFSDGESVNIDSLLEKNLVSLRSGKKPLVKILAHGELDKKLTVEHLPTSSKAKEVIEKAGGKVV